MAKKSIKTKQQSLASEIVSSIETKLTEAGAATKKMKKSIEKSADKLAKKLAKMMHKEEKKASKPVKKVKKAASKAKTKVVKAEEKAEKTATKAIDAVAATASKANKREALQPNPNAQKRQTMPKTPKDITSRQSLKTSPPATEPAADNA